MKRKFKAFTGLALVLSLLSSAIIGIAEELTVTKDLPLGSSGYMEMFGTIEPTILSVTMPTFVPFSISNNISGQNKVLSPRIPIKNNSNIPVQVNVIHTFVDLSKLQNTTWSDTGVVNENQIAIGFKKETTLNIAPTDLTNTRWLAANKPQNSNILILNPNQESAVYVVGTLGVLVSESATFNVTPTFIVSGTSQDSN